MYDFQSNHKGYFIPMYLMSVFAFLFCLINIVLIFPYLKKNIKFLFRISALSVIVFLIWLFSAIGWYTSG